MGKIHAYAVMYDGREIDRVFGTDNDDPAAIRDGLVDHDGYPDTITLIHVPTAARGKVTIDNQSIRELDLWADNTEPLYRQHQAIIANLKRKIARGRYSPALAPILWRHWYDEVARDYKREIGYQFPPAIRQACAEARAAAEYGRIMAGEYYNVEPLIEADETAASWCTGRYIPVKAEK